jgi:hypothetical protein
VFHPVAAAGLRCMPARISRRLCCVEYLLPARKTAPTSQELFRDRLLTVRCPPPDAADSASCDELRLADYLSLLTFARTEYAGDVALCTVPT